MPLNRPLRSGDQIEIVKALSAGPDRRWLDEDLGYTRNPYTLRHIRRWFARQPQEVLLNQGRALCEDELRRWDFQKSLDWVARKRGLPEEQFYLRVGRGEITPGELGTFILGLKLDSPETPPAFLTLEIQSMDRPYLLRDACQIVAEDDVNLHSAWARAMEETRLAVVQLTLTAPPLRKVVRIAHRLEQMMSVLQVQLCPTEVEPIADFHPFIMPKLVSTDIV